MAPGIEPVDGDDRAKMDGWFALRLRCHAHDTPGLPPPDRRRHAVRFRPSPGFASRAWVVRDGGEIVAAAEVTLPLRDNLEHGFAAVEVAPEHRRRGLGRRLLVHLAADARADGRARLALGATEPIGGPAGPGAAFLRAAGSRPAMTEYRRRLVLPPTDPDAWRALAASAARAADGYRLVQWIGAAPERWCADLAVLMGRMSTDSPMGGFALGPQAWDAARVRDREAEAEAAGERRVVTAVTAADGRLVAYTEISVPTPGENPGDAGDAGSTARQDDTLVAPEHRGHRLGLWIKLANLEQLTDVFPDVRTVETWNADDNPYMVAINDALGFLPVARVTDWELDLDRVAPDAEPGRPDGQAGTTAPISAAASGP